MYGLGAFQIATVTPNLSTDRDTITPVEVYVKDARRFTTRLGLGYGTEDKVRVSSDTRLLGFPGGARRLQLFFKHSYLDPYHVIITLMQPGYPTPRTTLATSPFIWRQREPSFTVNRVGANLGAIHQFSGNLGSSMPRNWKSMLQPRARVPTTIMRRPAPFSIRRAARRRAAPSEHQVGRARRPASVPRSWI